MADPTSLFDYSDRFTELLADATPSPNARAAALSMLARTVRDIPWHDRAAGRELAARIESHIDRAADPLTGMDELARAGRLVARSSR